MHNHFFGFFKRFQKQIILVFAFLFFATLPVSNNLNSATISILVAYWLFSGSFLNYKGLFNKYVILQVILYLFFVVGLFVSENHAEASFLIQQKASYLVFPIVLGMLPPISKKTVFIILMLFVSSCLFYSLYALVSAFYENFITQQLTTIDLNNFTYQKLAGYIHFHSTYFSIYLVFAIATLIYFINNKKYFLHRNKPVVIFCIFLLVLILFLLFTRMVLIAGFILVLIFLFKERIQNYKYLYLIGSAFIIVIMTLLLTNNSFKQRAKEVYNFNSRELIGTNNENGVTQRLFFWKNAIAIIREKPFFGHSSGDVSLAISKQYDKLLQNKKLSESQRKAINIYKTKKYNTHNQYLQILIAFGVFGLLYLLFLFFLFLRFSIINHNKLYFAFLLLFLMCLFTENLLERQTGIVFFMFFNCLFLFCYKMPRKTN